MVQIAGTYQHEKNENFVEYLVSLGFPEDKAKAADTLKPKFQVAIDGKKISLSSESAGVENSSSTYILGVEVDEQTVADVVVKSTAKLDGDTLTITSKPPNGKTGTRVYKFSDSGIVMSFSETNAKRYYKRV